MAHVLLSKEDKKLTRELAAWLYGLTPVPHERSIKQIRLARLRADIDEGRVIPFRWAYADLDGIKYRINGQHSSYLFQNGTAIPPHAVVNLEHYVCESIDDVCELWSMYDSNVSTRTDREITAHFQQTRPMLVELKGKAIELGKKALVLERWGLAFAGKASQPQKLQCIRNNEDFVVWVNQFMHHRSFLRVSVVLAMLKTYRISQTRATEFWEEVATGSNVDPYSGSRQLQLFLASTSSNLGGGSRSGKKKATLQQTVTAAITCWNAWRQKTQVRRLITSKVCPEPI